MSGNFGVSLHQQNKIQDSSDSSNSDLIWSGDSQQSMYMYYMQMDAMSKGYLHSFGWIQRIFSTVKSIYGSIDQHSDNQFEN